MQCVWDLEEVGDAEKSIRTMEAELNSAHDAKGVSRSNGILHFSGGF